jgi:hypothetical protein
MTVVLFALLVLTRRAEAIKVGMIPRKEGYFMVLLSLLK